VFFMMGEGLGRATDPTINNWKWDQVNDRLVHDMATVGSGCKVWLETYGTNQYRSWSRCGVNSTASGIHVINYYLGHKLKLVYSNCNSGTPMQVVLNGDGSLTVTSVTCPPTGGSFINYGQAVTVDASGVLSWSGTDGYHNDYTTNCVGGTTGTPTVDAPLGSGKWWSWWGPLVQDSSTANNTLSATCTAADTLLVDFGTVTPSCTADYNYSTITQGRETVVGSCTCLPLGYGITDYVAPNACSLKRITGDPARPAAPPPSFSNNVVRLNGTTFSSTDLPNETYYPNQIPVVGSDPNGGLAPGSGGTGTAGTYTPGSGVGGESGGVVASGGSGSGGSGGTEVCPEHQDCSGEGTPDNGFIPAAPVFDQTLPDAPSEADYPQDWPNLLSTWWADSPFQRAVTGSTITASGSCTVAATVTGAGGLSAYLSLGFESIPDSIWVLWRALVVLLANIAGFMLLWR
jgi:hypothetical protein